MKVSLKNFQHIKERKMLYISSEFFGGSFPREINIESHHTGNTVCFKPSKPGSKYFCEDQWDGEASCYEPTVPLENVECLMVRHEF